VSKKLEELIEFMTQDDRICPQPKQWTVLWELMLRHEKGEGKPGPSLVLAAWHATTDLDKRVRFKEHLEWAEQLGILDEVSTYLYNLSENEWKND